MWRHNARMSNAQDTLKRYLESASPLTSQQAIHTIWDLHDSDGNWDDPKAPIINERDWPKTFDGMDEFFRKSYGITSIPLAYIIRKHTTPKEEEETDWDDPLEQMIKRAPHTITEANGTIIKHPTFVTRCF